MFQGHQMSSQELMQNFLNGKDINEIEFHPQNLIKTTDNMPQSDLICGVTEQLNISGVTETPASPIESQKDEFCNFTPKEQDPMSMSFYQDKDEPNTFSTNPFDLNQVQILPDDDVSDSEQSKENQLPVQNNCQNASSPALEVHTPEISSPAGPMSPKSPIPELTELVSPDITASIKDENIEISKSPLSQHSTATPIDNVLKSPEIEASVEVHQQPKLNESPINEIIETSEDIINEISKDTIAKVEETLHFDEDVLREEEPKIVLADVVKEVEKDTANFIGDARKFVSDNINYLTDKIVEFHVVKGDAENALEHINEVVKEDKDDLFEEFTTKIDNELKDIHSQCQDYKQAEVDVEPPIDVAQLSQEIDGAVKEMHSSFMNLVTEHSGRDEIELIKEDIQERCATPHHELQEIVESQILQVEPDLTEDQQPEESDLIENVAETQGVIEEENVRETGSTLEFKDLPEVVSVSNVVLPEIVSDMRLVEDIPQPEKILCEPIETVQDIIDVLNQEPEPVMQEHHEMKEKPWQCVFPLPTQNELPIEHNIDIERKIITPEFAVPAVASPSEESKETPPVTPVVVEQDEVAKSPAPAVEALEKLTEEKRETDVKAEIIAASAVVTAVAGVAAATVAAKTAKPGVRSVAAPSKKPARKLSPTSPTKPPVKTTTTTAPSKKISVTSTAARTNLRVSSAPAKAPTTKAPVSSLKPTTKPAPKAPAARGPLTKPTTATTKPPTKLMNGDVKPPARAPITKRTAPGTSPASASKTSPTASKPPSRPASRPTTAPTLKPAPTARTATTASPKPRPAALSKPMLPTTKVFEYETDLYLYTMYRSNKKFAC